MNFFGLIPRYYQESSYLSTKSSIVYQKKVRRRRDMNSATFFAFKLPSKYKAIFICGTHEFRNLHIAKITMSFRSKKYNL